MQAQPHQLHIPEPEPEPEVRAKVAIITDTSWSMSPEEEWEEILLELRNWGLGADLVVCGHNLIEIEDKDIDLLIVDYGGMSSSGAADTAAHNIRYCCKWAEEHPGRLLVLWTRMTAAEYRYELEAELGHPNNIAYPRQYDRALLEAKVRAWFGIPLDIE